mmetsp:Transcript_37986/g.98320  ORF Transcript_37986/g.98320 Transcript_37986/m.98320 type:complete len:445 (+) Transcript_37986:353-1687(+)
MKMFSSGNRFTAGSRFRGDVLPSRVCSSSTSTLCDPDMLSRRTTMSTTRCRRPPATSTMVDSPVCSSVENSCSVLVAPAPYLLTSMRWAVINSFSCSLFMPRGAWTKAFTSDVCLGALRCVSFFALISLSVSQKYVLFVPSASFAFHCPPSCASPARFRTSTSVAVTLPWMISFRYTVRMPGKDTETSSSSKTSVLEKSSCTCSGSRKSRSRRIRSATCNGLSCGAFFVPGRCLMSSLLRPSLYVSWYLTSILLFRPLSWTTRRSTMSTTRTMLLCLDASSIMRELPLCSSVMNSLKVLAWPRPNFLGSMPWSFRICATTRLLPLTACARSPPLSVERFRAHIVWSALSPSFSTSSGENQANFVVRPFREETWKLSFQNVASGLHWDELVGSTFSAFSSRLTNCCRRSATMMLAPRSRATFLVSAGVSCSSSFSASPSSIDMFC